jgi:hypothetical protein
MSEDKIALGDIYDLTRNVTNAEINTGFILGLERVLMYLLTNAVEDKASIPALFKRFESILTGDTKPEDINFTETEANIYTIFALQQLLRSLAYEQGLVTKNDKTVNKEDIKELLGAYLENDVTKAQELISKLGLS